MKIIETLNVITVTKHFIQQVNLQIIQDVFTTQMKKDTDVQNVQNHLPPLENLNPTAKEKIKRFKCDYCEKSFFDKYRVIQLKVVHDKTTKEKHQCTKCDKSFTRKENLKIHDDRIHKNIKAKNHKCELCGKDFYFKCKLTTHQSVIHQSKESKERNFDCKACNGSFSEYRLLLRHIKRNHENIKMKCKFCEWETTEKYYMLCHYDNKHKDCDNDERKLKCDLCDSSFCVKRSLQDHIENVHKNQT